MANLKFTAENSIPTRVFTPMSNAPSTSKNLGMKQLRFDVDPATGRRRSKDGRKQNPNAPLANAISYRYGYFEPVHVKIRAISSTAQNAGMLNLNELYPIRPDEVLQLVASLKNAGIITRYSNYGNCIYIELNPIAKKFYDKEFAILHALNSISRKHVDECYYECVLADTYGSEKYVVDIIYREGSRVTFVVTALSKNITFPAQLDRIVKIANRLKSVTVVISPSVNINELMAKLRYMVNSGVSIKLVPFNQINLI